MTKCICKLCGGEVRESYQMNGYKLGSCTQCRTTTTLDMPDFEVLQDFYQGFTFEVDSRNYEKIYTEAVKDWMKGLIGERSSSNFLDVGGGGGFFAKAFEEFGFGESYYIDLDADACEFAKNEMGLTRVYCDGVEKLNEHVGEKKFDFIYCRHVIEHLREPQTLIFDCAELLAEGGILVIQCPNGTSKEGMLYPNYWMKFLGKVKRDNQWSLPRALLFSLTSRYGWGIDPVRHLWAHSGVGIKAIFSGRKEYEVTLESAILADPVYSPYWSPSKKLDMIAARISKILLGNFLQGMHLVVKIKKKSTNLV